MPALEPGIPSWLEAARGLLQPDASVIRMRAIAGAVGVHPVHLSRSFRRRFGLTMTDYLRGRRLEAASRALLETSHGVARIASEHGFSDQAHFTRAFKRATGLTPAAFRRRRTSR
jgi:AraC family transcriptional regulator